MLSVILGSFSRARVLAVLFAQAEPVSLRTLIREAGGGASGVQRDVARLESIGLLRSERRDGARLIALDDHHPLYSELRALVEKAASIDAVPDDLRRLNPAIRPLVPRIVESCARHHVERAALFGSSADAAYDVVPSDVDILIRFGDDTPDRMREYVDLKAELEGITGKPVDVVEEGAVRNRYFRDEVERTKVVIHGAA